MNYINFKNIIDDFKNIQKYHKQINSFGTGSIQQLIYLSQEVLGQDNTDEYAAPVYPLMYVIPGQVNRDDNFVTYNFSVVICDIMNTKNYDIQTELHSDTLQIAEDVLAQFKYSVTQAQGNYQSRYDLVLPSNIIPFSEAFDDLLVGWTINLGLVVDAPLNRCIAPFNPYPTESVIEEIPNLFYWYDFQDTTTLELTGSTILSIADKSYNEHNLTCVGDPQLVSGSYSGLSGYSAFQVLSGATYATGSTYNYQPSGMTIFAVFHNTNNITNFNIIGYVNSSQFPIVVFAPRSYRLHAAITSMSGMLPQKRFIPAPSITGPRIAMVFGDDTDVDNNNELYGAGVSGQTQIDTTATILPNTVLDLDTIYLGDEQIIFGDRNGQIFEVIGYDRILNYNERLKVINYLKDKYNWTNWY